MDLSYDQFMIVFYCGLIGAILFLILAVILLFVLRIPAVIGDLSGSTQRKAILEIRNNNGKIKPKVSSVNTKNKTSQKTGVHSTKKSGQTDKIIPNITTAKLKNINLVDRTNNTSDETRLLETDENETRVLNNAVESYLGYQSENGTVIDNNSEYTGQTTVLDNGTQVLVQADTENMTLFTVRTEITLFESTQIIV